MSAKLSQLHDILKDESHDDVIYAPLTVNNFTTITTGLRPGTPSGYLQLDPLTVLLLTIIAVVVLGILFYASFRLGAASFQPVQELLSGRKMVSAEEETLESQGPLEPLKPQELQENRHPRYG